MDTSPLIGDAAGPFSLEFQLDDGSGTGDANNTALLSAFDFGVGGSAVGSPDLIGGAAGSVGAGFSLIDSSFFNALVQPFNPGSLLSFQLNLTTNPDAGGTPDEFSFAILDNTDTELPTTGFIDAFLVVDIDSVNPTPQVFDSDPSRPPAGGGDGITMSAPLALPQAVPDPGAFALAGIGLVLLLFSRKR